MIQTFKIITLLLLLTITSIYGQQHDNVWTFGYTCVPGDSSEFGGTNLYFDDGEIRGEYHCRDIRFKNNCTASISNSEGDLMLMFNGCTLNDGNNKLVEGGELLVRNDTNIEQTWWCDDGYNVPHGAIFLPDPYNENRYYLFYRDIIQIDEQPYVLSDSFYLGIIEIIDGLPKVLEKQVIITDTVSIVGSSAIKHANGRDWWIIIKNQNENIYHTILLNKDGIRLEGNQKIGAFQNITSNGNTTITYADGTIETRKKEINKIVVYPNPANGRMITIDFNNEMLDDIDLLQIFDSQGRNVYSEQQIDEKMLQVNIESWNKGIYYIKYQRKDKTFNSVKFINI